MNTILTGSLSRDIITPSCAWITVNRACNLRCGGCYAKSTGYGAGQDMDFGLAKKIVGLISALDIKCVTVIGGEPTLWNHLTDFNKLCRENNLKTTVVTNAIRFGADGFWSSYMENPSTRVGISIKAFDKASLKEIAGVDSFKLAEKGLRRAISHFKCGVSTVYSTSSADSILDLARFAMDCGAKSLTISPCTPSFCDGVAEGEYIVEANKMVAHIVDVYPKLVEITGGNITFSMKLPLCLWPKGFVENLVQQNQISTVCQVQQKAGIVFDVDGQLMLCNSLFDFPLGKFGIDFTDKDSLVALMNSQKTVDMYNALTAYPSEKCISCSWWNVCAGGCPLYWTLLNPKDVIKGASSHEPMLVAQ